MSKEAVAAAASEAGPAVPPPVEMGITPSSLKASVRLHACRSMYPFEFCMYMCVYTIALICSTCFGLKILIGNN